MDIFLMIHCLLDTYLTCCVPRRRTEVIAWQNSQAENSFWHETIVTGYQSRTYAECGDVNEVYRKMIGARDKVRTTVGDD